MTRVGLGRGVELGRGVGATVGVAVGGRVGVALGAAGGRVALGVGIGVDVTLVAGIPRPANEPIKRISKMAAVATPPII
jgi:hypothetical protein